jgi:hypothetical protein
MADYLTSDRVALRSYLGFSSLYLQADPRLENAIDASRAVADGGQQPDNSLQLQVLSFVAACVACDLAIANSRALYGATQAGKGAINIDAAREMGIRRSEGSMYVARLARIFDLESYVDPYYGTLVVVPQIDRYPRDRSAY